MKSTRKLIELTGALFLLAGCSFASAQQVPSLPLASIQDLVYVGAFEVSDATFGESRISYSEGPIGYNAANDSLFVVGHAHQQAVAEFPIPTIVNSTRLADLNSTQPRQAFSRLLNRAATGNPQNIDTVGGLTVIGNELFVNGYEYYDADGNVTHTTLVVRNRDNLSGSNVAGYYRLSPRAHASKWISRIPQEWQAVLGGSYIAGASSGGPIISRHSVGPSAFAFDPNDMAPGTSTNNTVQTITLLDFSLDEPLHADLDNDSRSNDLWTHISSAVYGFIIPGTRTYLTIGSSGGHESGVGYKPRQDNGNLCAGYCSYAAADNYNYYWAWDVNDMVDVKNGRKRASDVRPYAYGKLTMPFQGNGFNAIIGATFDPESGRLFVSIGGAGSGEESPVFVVYSLNAEDIVRPNPPTALSIE